MAWQIVGHDWAVALLRHSLAAGRLSHAYLFSGPPQVGKTTLALRLAQALNCDRSHGSDAPCLACSSCTRIGHGLYPDVEVITGKGANNTIQIDQIRELQRKAVLSPYEGRYRVFILRQMDRAGLPASNCLLKTLEEPPAHVILVLTAVHPESLPATVLSRCQNLNLRLVPTATIESALLGRGEAPAQAQLLAHLSSGRIGWALSASRDESYLRQREQALNQLYRLLGADSVDRLDFAWKASREPDASRALIELWTVWWRDVLLMRSHGPVHTVNVDQMDALKALAARMPLAGAEAMLTALQETANQLEANVNPRLAWEGLALRLPHLRPEMADV